MDKDDIDLKKRKTLIFLGNIGKLTIAAGIFNLIGKISSAADYPLIYTPREIPPEVKYKHRKMIDAVNDIEMAYTFGKRELLTRIDNMPFYQKGDLTYIQNYARLGQKIKSGGCFELCIAEAKRIFDVFSEKDLFKDYNVEIVRGEEPRFFRSALSHSFIRIISKEDKSIFHRDPSFNMTLEYSVGSGYNFRRCSMNLKERARYWSTHFIISPKMQKALGINERNEIVSFSGYDLKKGVFGYSCINRNGKARFGILDSEHIERIYDSELESLLHAISRKTPVEIDDEKSIETFTLLDFTKDW